MLSFAQALCEGILPNRPRQLGAIHVVLPDAHLATWTRFELCVTRRRVLAHSEDNPYSHRATEHPADQRGNSRSSRSSFYASARFA